MQSQLDQFFSPVSQVSTIIPRLALQLEALEKSGKTHYALATTPDPVVVVSNDPGTQIVAEKLVVPPYSRRIKKMDLDYPSPDPTVRRGADVDKNDWAVWQREWARVHGMKNSLLSEPPGPNRTRTVVFDTWDQIWELCMLNHFGKTQNIQQNLRTTCNADFSNFFWDLYKHRPDLNMIFIHRLKKQYAKNTKGEDSWTGAYEARGFNQSAFLVDLCIRCGWDPAYKCFYSEVNNVTRFGSEYMGMRLMGPQSNFAILAMSIFPQTQVDPGYWGWR